MDHLSDWLEEAQVEHPTFGRGRLVPEPNSGWVHFVPESSGPSVTLPIHKAISEVRVIASHDLADDEVEDLDWAAATWSALVDVDQAVADEMADLLVVSLFTAGGLDHRWRAEAADQLQLDLGCTPKEAKVIRIGLPLGGGEAFYEWDGTRSTARAIARGAGDAAGRAIVVERAAGSPCGWETNRPASPTD